VLETLPERSIHCCVTSPPYWGLRDYGTGTWEGGDPSHEHFGKIRCTAPATSEKQNSNAGSLDVRAGDCDCGAKKIDAQIGLEQTSDAYVAQIVAVMRGVHRVLHDDGTLWLNLGDSYASHNKGSGGPSAKQDTNAGSRYGRFAATLDDDTKPKDLVGIPWQVAFALRADGWYLRSDIIWHKPNPMPESITDRPTKSHEYIFLLSKSSSYYYDADAIAEPAVHGGRVLDYTGDQKANTTDPMRQATHIRGRVITVPETRNKRTVWSVCTSAYAEAHFATFPPKLILPCILAGSPVGGTVLDPFNGSGTTGMVACRRGRNYVGIELNPDYVEMSRHRIHNDDPMFNREIDELSVPFADDPQMKLL
jgi:DNA modification methylase